MRTTHDLGLGDSDQTGTRNSKGFFNELSDGTLRDFEQIRLTRTCARGAILFSEGEEPRGVFVLFEGHAKLSVSSSEGKTLILRLAVAGEVLGLNATISGRPYAATAKVLRPCRVNFVRGHDFLRFLNGHLDARMKAI